MESQPTRKRITWFTANWQLNWPEQTLFRLFRPYKSTAEMHQGIFEGIQQSGFVDGDELYVLGNVAVKYDEIVHTFLMELKEAYPNSLFHLVTGPLDHRHLDKLEWFFDRIQWSNKNGKTGLPETFLRVGIGGEKLVLNHHPQFGLIESWGQVVNGGLVGGGGSGWQHTTNLINVGVDVWHMRPVPSNTILNLRKIRPELGLEQRLYEWPL